MSVYTARPLVLHRPLQRRKSGRWETAPAHLTLRGCPPLPAGERIAGLSECRLYRGQVEQTPSGVRAVFAVEFLFRTGGPLRPGRAATFRQPLVLEAPADALPQNGPPAEGLAAVQARGTVYSGAVAPDRRELLATVSLVVSVVRRGA